MGGRMRLTLVVRSRVHMVLLVSRVQTSPETKVCQPSRNWGPAKVKHQWRLSLSLLHASSSNSVHWFIANSYNAGLLQTVGPWDQTSPITPKRYDIDASLHGCHRYLSIKYIAKKRCKIALTILVDWPGALTLKQVSFLSGQCPRSITSQNKVITTMVIKPLTVHIVLELRSLYWDLSRGYMCNFCMHYLLLNCMQFLHARIAHVTIALANLFSFQRSPVLTIVRSGKMPSSILGVSSSSRASHISPIP